ncbi:hypothetical protein WJX75_001411 [Coccomyxa subellipsoidea]|uniref:SREBP regulating gene protein n=1 Tax=Coccomyxa subellipsoidea TaxID=248742 RepID=A0ABR2Z1R9_9CHLO
MSVLGNRSLRIRDIPTTLQGCNNTIQGRWHIADSQGMLCSRDNLRPDNGCCSAGEKYSCATPETGQWANTFEYCRNKCRTSSKSTVHENAYLSTFHHCFSSSGKPTTAAPPTPPIPESVTVVLGTMPVKQGVKQTQGQQMLPSM